MSHTDQSGGEIALRDSTGANSFKVSHIKSPFSVQGGVALYLEGMTLKEILHNIQPQVFFHSYAEVFINGHKIDRDLWASVRPKKSTEVTIRFMPQGGGGGGKNPLRIILSIALLAVAPYAAAGLSSAMAGAAGGINFTNAALGFGLTTAGVSNAIVGIAGRLIINAIAPPSKPKSNFGGSATARDNPALFITGARNQVTPFGTIPKVLGRHRVVPPQAAKPFTETVGSDQYVRQLFCWGYGPVRISDLKIGETPIDEFDDVEIETVYGYNDDPDLTLFPNDVNQEDLSIKLSQADGFTTRTTANDVDEISVDITFPQGLLRIDEQTGDRQSQTVEVEVQYSVKDADDWTSGVETFKSIAAQSSDLIRPAGRFMPIAQPLVPFTYGFRKRKDIVYIDKASGAVGVATGAQDSYGFLADGTIAPQVAGSVFEPTDPPIPNNKIAVARVTTLGDEAVWALEDLRDGTLIGDEIEDSGDFVASEGAAVSGAKRIDLTAGGLKFKGFSVTSKSQSAIRRTARFQVPRGQYDVRLRRITADSTDSNTFNDVVWSALRSITNESPVSKSGLALTAVRIKATDQLNGAIDQFNGIVSSVVLDWDGTDWIEQESSNPASLYRHVLQGSANARAIGNDRLDLTKLQDWHDQCNENLREYNAVLSSAQSVYDVLQSVAAAGRASPTIIDGLWAVVTDEAQTVPVQHFTPRNSYGFRADRVYPDHPHALRVQFTNRDKGWQPDERIVYDDGYDEGSATKFETIEFSGITSSDQAWRDGRYHIASARLRPETYTFNADIEHIVCTRGDMIRFTHDVPLFGLMSGRVSGVTDDGTNVTGIDIDAKVEMVTGTDYVCRFRRSDGSTLLLVVNTADGEQSSLTFTTPPLIADAPQVGDLFMFGEGGSESVELIVNKITPNNDLTASISCLDYAPALQGVDEGDIPAFDSQVTIPLELRPLVAPIVREVQTGEEVLILNADGSYTTRAVLTFENQNGGRDIEPIINYKATSSNVFQTASFTGNADQVSIMGLDVGETYDFSIRYKSAAGVLSSETQLNGVLFEGDGNPPANVQDFDIDIQGQTANLSWSPNTEYDLNNYELRFSNALTGATWGTSLPVKTNIQKGSTSIAVNASIGTFLIKAQDRGGRYSENAAAIVTNINALDGLNVVATITESPSFNGQKDGLGVDGGSLVLLGASIDDWLNVDGVNDFDLGEGGLQAGRSGTYNFESAYDLGDVYTSKLTALVAASGVNVAFLFDEIENIDIVENIDGTGGDPSNWSVKVDVRFTDDDPAGSPVNWSPWQPFIIGDYTARAFEFRARLETLSSGIQPKIDTLEVEIDMPDRVVSGDDIETLSSGVKSVTFPNGAFRQTPSIAIAAQDLATGDYYTITNKSASGFDIEFFDSTDVRIIRTFDYVAKGFGKISV